MNQYPGFVPMVVPQPYMVAMPTAIPMSAAVGPGLPALPQALHPQVAAAHVAGAPVVTSAVNATGMASAVRAAQLSQGVGQLSQSMGQLAAQGMGQLAPGMGQLGAPGMGQPLGLAGMPGMPGLPQPHPHQSPVSIPTAKVIPQIPASSPDSRKRHFGDQDKGKGGRFGNRWQSNPEQDVEEPTTDDTVCVLDHFNSDLNLVIESDGHAATVLLDPPGFCFTWAGARATHGVCKGKVFYEVHILENLPVDFGDDHQEMDPNVLRVGWSIDSSSFQLGEEPWSFGYGGTGKFSTNCRFSDYGQRFGAGDVVGAMLDLDSRPATISFTKNGTWFGVAIPLHGFPVGSKDMALYPHILSKNCRFKVNFGQQDAWFPPPQGFTYIGQLPVQERVRGMKCPERKADCEMIMIVGLPGVGKTTWGINMQKSHPEKRYNIIGTDTLIDKMRVMGLPRKRNYHGRWEVLIDKSTKCLNKLFQVASRRKRNYILDQTNVYASARRRKMKFFNGFFRIAAVIQPDDPEMQRRSTKRTVEDGKIVPESAVLEMKANFSLPEDRDALFDRIDFIELPRDKVVGLVEQYMREGQEKRPPREEVFRHDNRFQKQDQTMGFGHQGSRPQQNQSPFGQQRPIMGGPSKSPMGGGQGKGSGQWYGEGDGLLGQAPSMLDPVSKRVKLESAQQQGGALDLLKQQYDEADLQDASQWGQGVVGNPTPNQELVVVKEEWPPHSQEAAMAVGPGMSVHGTPLPPHLTQQGGALVVSHPPGTIPLTGALGTQPPPPPPPVLPGQLAHTAAGHAFVALAPLPPPGPPPAMLAMGGAGALGAAPSGFPPQLEGGAMHAWQIGGIQSHAQGAWQLPESSGTTTVTTSSHFSQADTSTARRSWEHSAADDGQQVGWQVAAGAQQQPGWQAADQSRDVAKGDWQTTGGASQGWQGQDHSRDVSQRGGQFGFSSQAQSWQSQERGRDSGPRGGQSWQGGAGPQQQMWSGQDRGMERNPKGWQSSDNTSGTANSWQKTQGTGDSSKAYDADRDKFGAGGNQRESSRTGSFDSQSQSYSRDSSTGSDMPGRRFDDFSRPPPDSRAGGRSDDFLAGDGGGGGKGFGRGGQHGDSGSSDRWGSSQQRGRGTDRWNSGSTSRQDRPGPPDSGDRRWSGGGRQDARDQSDRWGSRGQDRFSGGRDHDRGRDLDRSRERGGDRDRDRAGDRDRGVDRDRDRLGRDRERDQDRDSYRDSYRDRERDRGSRDRDHDSSEPRQRRRKSKWDTPEDEGTSKMEGDSSFQSPAIKEEPNSAGYGGPPPPPSSFQSDQQQYYSRPGQYQSQERDGTPGQNTFPPRGMNFNKPPPPTSMGPGAPPGQGTFSKDRSSDLPSLMDVQVGSRPPPPPAPGRDRGADNSKPVAGETSLLGPVPSGPPPRFQGNQSFTGSSGGGNQATVEGNSSDMDSNQSSVGGNQGNVGSNIGSNLPDTPSTATPSASSNSGNLLSAPGPNTSVPPPRDGPPPPPFGGRGGPGMNRPPMGPPRFSGPPGPGPGPDPSGRGGGQRPNFRMEGPPRPPMRPRNPQNFSGPPGNMGPMGGPPPNAPWNQNRFGGGGGRGGMPPRPRFDGPGGPGGGRFPGGPGPMRWPRGPR